MERNLLPGWLVLGDRGDCKRFSVSHVYREGNVVICIKMSQPTALQGLSFG